MTTLADVTANNLPRLVVKFKRNLDGSENFEWGVVGQIPILSLIGHIAVVQSELTYNKGLPRQCEQDALVMVWDNSDRTMTDYLHPVIPIEPLVGMLETIKDALINARMAQLFANQKRVLGPDGSVMRG